MKYGALASVSESEVLAGANIAAIGDEAAGYEIIQFAAAELIAENTYRVKTLLRGQAGSGPEMLARSRLQSDARAAWSRSWPRPSSHVLAITKAAVCS